MFVGIDHVGVAVRNLAMAVQYYRDVLGFRLEGVHDLVDRKVKVAFFSTGGETQIELLEPIGSESVVAKFLESRGEGVHHFAVKVDDLEAVIKSFKEKGVTLIGDKPRVGAEGSKVAFVHPKSAHGVLLEFVEKR
jgi:methylmalonyl-CoA epimerase